MVPQCLVSLVVSLTSTFQMLLWSLRRFTFEAEIVDFFGPVSRTSASSCACFDVRHSRLELCLARCRGWRKIVVEASIQRLFWIDLDVPPITSSRSHELFSGHMENRLKKPALSLANPAVVS